MYENDREGIQRAIEAFRQVLAEEGIGLELVIGADTHLAPDLLQGIRESRVPTLNGSRYLLLEPPHHSVPPRFEESVFQLRAAGIVPVITHPERLSWIESHYQVFERLVHAGAWMQVTSGALTGRFGKRPSTGGSGCSTRGWCTSSPRTPTTSIAVPRCWRRAAMLRRSGSGQRRPRNWCPRVPARS